MRSRIGAVLDSAQRLGERLEQPHEIGLRQAARLCLEARITLGRDPQLFRHVTEGPDDEQLARMYLEIARGDREVAPTLGEARGGRQRCGGVVRRNRVERAEEDVLV